LQFDGVQPISGKLLLDRHASGWIGEELTVYGEHGSLQVTKTMVSLKDSGGQTLEVFEGKSSKDDIMQGLLVQALMPEFAQSRRAAFHRHTTVSRLIVNLYKLGRSQKLQAFFDVIRLAAEAGRRADPQFDGWTFWQPIKKLLAGCSVTASNWKPLPPDVSNVVLALHEEPIDFHFLVQHARIPNDSKPTLQKIGQLALNIGQLHGGLAHTVASDSDLADVMEAIGYSNLHLDRLTTYLELEVISSMSAEFPDELLQCISRCAGAALPDELRLHQSQRC